MGEKKDNRGQKRRQVTVCVYLKQLWEVLYFSLTSRTTDSTMGGRTTYDHPDYRGGRTTYDHLIYLPGTAGTL